MICLLKDKRIVSSSSDNSITVYNHSYKPQIKIENAHDDKISSLCELKNGELVSSSADKKIKIWKINGDNYNLTHTLEGHTDAVNKVIELEDGKLSSSSNDKTIKIWDNYQCIQTLTGHKNNIISLLEFNHYIISAPSSSKKDGLRKWSKSEYECVKVIENVKCNYYNGLKRINKNIVISAAENELFIVDIESSKVVDNIQDESIKINYFNFILREHFILFGNNEGEICCYDLLFNQIILKKKVNNRKLKYLIETEDNQIISYSDDKTINIYS